MKKYKDFVKFSCIFEKKVVSLQRYVGVQGQSEVDFVGIKGEQKIYVQVCWEMAGDEETAKREYAPLLKIADQYRKVVVTLDEIRFPNNNGIEHLFPWELSTIL